MTGCSQTETAHPPRTAAYRRITISHMMPPQGTNPTGIVHGGIVMKDIGDAAGAVSLRHIRGSGFTAFIVRRDVHNPALIANLPGLN